MQLCLLFLLQGTSGAPTSQAGCLAWLEQHGVTTTATRAAQGLDGHATWQGFEAAVAAAGRWMQQRERLGERQLLAVRCKPLRSWHVPSLDLNIMHHISHGLVFKEDAANAVRCSDLVVF